MSEELNQSIISRFGRLARRLRGHDCHRGHKQMADLTGLQMQALMYLKHQPSVKTGELAKSLALSTSSTSLLVDRLVAGGWVERFADKDDRRVVHIRLVPRLHREFKRHYGRQVSRINDILDQLPLKDRQELDRILTNLEDLA